MRDLNFERLKAILDDLEKSDATTIIDPDHAKLSDYFNSYMDQETIENRGVEPLNEVLSVAFNAEVSKFSFLFIIQSNAVFSIAGLRL